MAILSPFDLGNNVGLFRIYEQLYNIATTGIVIAGSATEAKQDAQIAQQTFGGSVTAEWLSKIFGSVATASSQTQLINQQKDGGLTTAQIVNIISAKLIGLGGDSAGVLLEDLIAELELLLKNNANPAGFNNAIDVLYQSYLKQYTLSKEVFAPQLISSATNINVAVLASTADATLYAVTGGKTFYLSDLTIVGSAVALGQVHLRDGAGGNIIYTFRVGVSSGANIATVSFRKPKQLTTSLYIDFISGTTLSVDVVAGGIEL